MPHNLAIAQWLSDMAATPDPVKQTSGIRCPLCGYHYNITRGRRCKRWLAMHALNPHCKRWGDFLRPHAATEEQAIENVREVCEA